MQTNELRLMPALQALKQMKDNENFVIDKTGVKMVEIMDYHATFNPAQPELIFNGRKTPMKYVEAELQWYDSQDRHVNFIGEKAKIWKDIASKDGLVNSNYGWCIYSEDNGLQYANCLKELCNNRESRRAVMIYTRPSMHNDYCENGMSDFICTNTVQCFIRHNKLYYCVYMRSNDAIFGFFNDFAWHCTVYQRLLADLQKTYPSLELSQNGLKWCAASFHVYERHFEMLDKMCEII